MFKYPVYRHPTHDRFYYILFDSHIIILWGEQKNDNFMHQSYTHNSACVSDHSWFVYAHSVARGSLLVARCSFECSPVFSARGYRWMPTSVSLQWVIQFTWWAHTQSLRHVHSWWTERDICVASLNANKAKAVCRLDELVCILCGIKPNDMTRPHRCRLPLYMHTG